MTAVNWIPGNPEIFKYVLKKASNTRLDLTGRLGLNHWFESSAEHHPFTFSE